MAVTPFRLSTVLAQALDWVKAQEQAAPCTEPEGVDPTPVPTRRARPRPATGRHLAADEGAPVLSHEARQRPRSSRGPDTLMLSPAAGGPSRPASTCGTPQLPPPAAEDRPEAAATPATGEAPSPAEPPGGASVQAVSPAPTPEPPVSQAARKVLNAGINTVVGLAAGGLLGTLAALVWPPLGLAVGLVAATSLAFSGIEWLGRPS